VEDVVNTMTANPLARDLDHVLARTGGLWEDLRGGRLFITGGTGFFGCWLLETFLRANDELDLGASVVVLTRNGGAFERRAPHIAAHKDVTLQHGDVRTFEFADGGFSHVIHAAVDARPPRDRRDRLLVFDTIVEGTRRTLEFARRARAGRFLLASTGAVYGRQPADLTHVPEEYAGGPDSLNAALAGAEAKRAAEMMCAVYADADLVPAIARCFGFVGPYLPLDAHFAAGNFIGDALKGGPIQVHGDGTPQRSYLYAADLAIWLWTILLRGQSMRSYNVGSEAAISIAGLAQAVAGRFAPAPAVHIAGTPAAGAAPERYVPGTARARTELGLAMTVDFDEALTRTVDWYRGRAAATHVHN
jgi:nucleoside-diphosphate-sugar epimerase